MATSPPGVDSLNAVNWCDQRFNELHTCNFSGMAVRVAKLLTKIRRPRSPQELSLDPTERPSVIQEDFSTIFHADLLRNRR